MGRDRLQCRFRGILFFAFAASVAGSTVSFISGGVFGFETSLSTGRNLLQAKKNCPVDFEFSNYTIITSQCKGPDYRAKLCCPAFMEFACPYSAELNDLTNDCATTMFSYINLYGKYPPGLFANECTGSKRGLECNGNSTSLNSTATGAAPLTAGLPTLGVFAVGSLLYAFFL